MKQLAYHTLDTIKIIILAAILVAGMQYVFALSGPPGNPPPDPCPSGQPGCDPPVNVGSAYQAKIGNGIGADWFGAFSMKIVDEGNREDILLSANNGITVSDGDIQVSNGAIKGASIENLNGSARIDSSGAVTAGQGTFTGGVMVGVSGDSSNAFTKIDAEAYISGNGPTSGCADISDLGKMIYDYNNHNLYICGNRTLDESGNPSSPAYFWRWVTLTDR